MKQENNELRLAEIKQLKRRGFKVHEVIPQADSKVGMWDHFLNHIPQWVSSILIADESKSIKQYKGNVLPISIIEVTDSDKESASYDNSIKNLQIVNDILTAIDKHIDYLNTSNYNPFLRNPAAKISALDGLKQQVCEAHNNNTKINVRSLIDQWEMGLNVDAVINSNQLSIIAQNRNIFFTTNYRQGEGETSTSTKRFIEKLKDKYILTELNENVEHEEDPSRLTY